MTNQAALAYPASAEARIAQAFTTGLNLNDIHLPVSHDRTNCGTILDAEGNGFMVVDLHRERPDDQVMAIAELVVIAINSRAGMIPEIEA